MSSVFNNLLTQLKTGNLLEGSISSNKTEETVLSADNKESVVSTNSEIIVSDNNVIINMPFILSNEYSATLSEISLYGVKLNKFSPTTKKYIYSLPSTYVNSINRPTIDDISYVVSYEGISCEIEEPANIDSQVKSQRTMTINVTSANGKNTNKYYITFNKKFNNTQILYRMSQTQKSADVNISYFTCSYMDNSWKTTKNGSNKYNVSIPYAYRNIAYLDLNITPENSYSKYTIYPESSYIMSYKYANITMVAEDGSVKNYKLNVEVEKNNDATLSYIWYDNNTYLDISLFDSTTSYNVEIPWYRSDVPTVKYTLNDENATSTSTVNGNTTNINVTAANGRNTKEYTVNFVNSKKYMYAVVKDTFSPVTIEDVESITNSSYMFEMNDSADYNKAVVALDSTDKYISFAVPTAKSNITEFHPNIWYGTNKDQDLTQIPTEAWVSYPSQYETVSNEFITNGNIQYLVWNKYEANSENVMTYMPVSGNEYEPNFVFVVKNN